jgi:hypothetical protein
MALSNMTQFESGGREEAKVVAAYADELRTKLRQLGWNFPDSLVAVQAAMPAIVVAVSGRGK